MYVFGINNEMLVIFFSAFWLTAAATILPRPSTSTTCKCYGVFFDRNCRKYSINILDDLPKQMLSTP